MELIFESIHDALNELIPDAKIEHFGDLNKFMAYFLTLGIVYHFIAKPVMRLFKGGK